MKNKTLDEARKAYMEAEEAKGKAWEAVKATPEYKAWDELWGTDNEAWAESIAYAYSEREE